MLLDLRSKPGVKLLTNRFGCRLDNRFDILVVCVLDLLQLDAVGAVNVVVVGVNLVIVDAVVGDIVGVVPVIMLTIVVTFGASFVVMPVVVTAIVGDVRSVTPVVVVGFDTVGGVNRLVIVTLTRSNWKSRSGLSSTMMTRSRVGSKMRMSFEGSLTGVPRDRLPEPAPSHTSC